MLFNPFTGTPRHPDDIKSDPDGFLLWDDEARLKAAKAAPPAQPFAWYDPSADKFTRDLDDPSMNRGAVLWRLFLDARPIQAPELSDAEIRAWWGSENGLEDMNMCKIDDFTKTVRAVITRLNAKVPA